MYSKPAFSIHIINHMYKKASFLYMFKTFAKTICDGVGNVLIAKSVPSRIKAGKLCHWEPVGQRPR